MSDGPCVLPHAEDDPHRAEIGYLCGWHRRRMTTTTTQLTELWADLALIIEAGTAPKDEAPKTRHLKSAEAQAPANLEVLALHDPRSSPIRLPERWADGQHYMADDSTPIPPVLTIVAGWVLCLAEERPLSAVLPRSVIAQLALLERHHDWIAAQAWVDDYVNEMRGLHDAVKLALRDYTHREIGYCRLPADPGACGGTLLAENGTGVIRCTRCRASWVTAQQQAMLAVTLESS